MAKGPLRAIREKCLDCSAGSFKEVRLCPMTDCPLWPWRFGRRPATIAKSHPEYLHVEPRPEPTAQAVERP